MRPHGTCQAAHRLGLHGTPRRHLTPPNAAIRRGAGGQNFRPHPQTCSPPRVPSGRPHSTLENGPRHPHTRTVSPQGHRGEHWGSRPAQAQCCRPRWRTRAGSVYAGTSSSVCRPPPSRVGSNQGMVQVTEVRGFKRLRFRGPFVPRRPSMQSGGLLVPPFSPCHRW